MDPMSYPGEVGRGLCGVEEVVGHWAGVGAGVVWIGGGGRASTCQGWQKGRGLGAWV